MQTVTINCQKSYAVQIGEGLFTSLGDRVRSLFSCDRAVIITDSIVDVLYADACQASLEKAGFQTQKYVFLQGEASKNLNNYGAILEFLGDIKLTRADVIIALGGGVVGDLAGFVAATYLRGIAFVQVPTTLLAAVDSSVGGKTAVNLQSGKNLAGTFYQPSLVVCDYELFTTLQDRIIEGRSHAEVKERVFRDGTAEVIKYGVIMNKAFYDSLNTPIEEQLEAVITACVAMKEEIVRQDEYDQGIRQLLNFGHTIGHAIEAKSEYAISHGYAVAMGMACMAKISWQEGWCPKADYDELCRLLESYGFSLAIPYTAEELYEIVLMDKKRKNDTITLVVMHALGNCQLKKVSIEAFKALLIQGMKA